MVIWSEEIVIIVVNRAVIARSEIIRRIISRRSNPVTTREEFSHGIASSPSRSLHSLGLLAMTSYFPYN
jgi:hypothetical protein